MRAAASSLRVGDAEREAVVTALSRHYAEGRLTRLEHEERTGLALEARIGADLDALCADLPPHDGGSRRAEPTHRRRLRAVAWRLALVALAISVVVHLLPLLAFVGLAFLASRVLLRRRFHRSRSAWNCCPRWW
ncbi:MAG TPA: DUF1707 domain-containing protein [Mycobacteriales bacterium]|nr:DUF1707 domain-containing protein [Mycobacteriales bacterium]